MKKILSLLLAALFCLFVLAGCAPAEQEAAAPVPTQAAAQEETPSAEQTAKATTKPTAKAKSSAKSSAAAKPAGTAKPTGTTKPSAARKSAETVNPGAAAVNGGSAATGQTPRPTQTPPPAQTPKPTPKPTPEPAPAMVNCTVSIDCATALSVNPDLANAVSSGGSILGGAAVTIPAGGTVYDALVATGIAFGGSSSYISSINSLGEGDCGAGSGWMYSVNGSYPGVGCGSYTVAEGDSIAWRYTCNLGADLGASVG